MGVPLESELLGRSWKVPDQPLADESLRVLSVSSPLASRRTVIEEGLSSVSSSSPDQTLATPWLVAS